MAENKKAALGQGWQTNNASTSFHGSQNHFTGCKEESQAYIFDMLPKGEENAITTKELRSKTGYNSVRCMTQAIEAERRRNLLILSKCDRKGGYFRPADGEQGYKEVSAYLRQMERRAKSIFYTVKAAREYCKDYERNSHDKEK